MQEALNENNDDSNALWEPNQTQNDSCKIKIRRTCLGTVLWQSPCFQSIVYAVYHFQVLVGGTTDM